MTTRADAAARTPSFARLYFIVQGCAVVAWWALLVVRPGVREPFEIAGAPPIALLAFAPGDLLILGAGSLAAGLARRGERTTALAWLVAGATVYGTLYTLASSVSGHSGWLGPALMTPAAIASLLAARSLSLAHDRDLSTGGAGHSRS